MQVLRRSMKQFGVDELTDRAAALTYYGIQAIFPGLLVLVSILGMLGHNTTQSLMDNIGQIAPGGVRTFLQNVVNNAQKQRGAAGLAAILGLVLAVCRRPGTWRPSCAPATGSTASRRAGRSGRPRRCGSG